MSEESALRLIQQARKTNAGRSASERKAGFGAVEDSPADLQMRTVMSALHCGLATEDWNAVAEGYAMLGDLHRQTAGVDYRPEEMVPPIGPGEDAISKLMKSEGISFMDAVDRLARRAGFTK